MIILVCNFNSRIYLSMKDCFKFIFFVFVFLTYFWFFFINQIFGNYLVYVFLIYFCYLFINQIFGNYLKKLKILKIYKFVIFLLNFFKNLNFFIYWQINGWHGISILVLIEIRIRECQMFYLESKKPSQWCRKVNSA